LKLNFICYLNIFFTFDYSLWDGGDIRFCGQKQTLIVVLKQGLQVLFHIVMAKLPIPENCSAYVPMILKEFCSSKINDKRTIF
jgi:hypothetical protein